MLFSNEIPLFLVKEKKKKYTNKNYFGGWTSVGIQMHEIFNHANFIILPDALLRERTFGKTYGKYCSLAD